MTIRALLNPTRNARNERIVAAQDQWIEKLEREKSDLVEKVKKLLSNAGRLGERIPPIMKFFSRAWETNTKGSDATRQIALRPALTRQLICSPENVFALRKRV